ncbi:MAG: membrane protein insertase YidC [Tannerellaceae bacterium]|jgi:YidC/Oxa1 family membrane protein insertase|nr:membrane protein insertase YidC [Tannerellaceae bacterium]
MDKNTVIGFSLIGAILIGFTWLNRPSETQLAAEKRYRDSIAAAAEREQAKELVPERETAVPAITEPERSFFAEAETDTVLTLENDKVEVRISSRGGYVSYVRLKEYDNYKGEPLVLFDGRESVFDLTLATADRQVLHTRDARFQAIQDAGKEGRAVVMRLETGSEGAYLELSYQLAEDDYRLYCTVRAVGLNGRLAQDTEPITLLWQQDVRQQEKGRKFEDRYAGLFYRTSGGEVDNLSETQDAAETVEGRLQWIGFKDMFFSTVLVAGGIEGFGSPKLESTALRADGYLKRYRAAVTLPFDLHGDKVSELTFYFVPNKFALLRSFDAGKPAEERMELTKMVSLGAGLFRWINQYFILPVFDFMGRYIDNYGIIIFLLTIIVKLILFPLTYKSYISTAKMRVLRPQVEEINAQYPGQDKAMERQRATMDLYSRAGASPMSGCVPMLLQMPILIALFMFFPSAIELRHESFLWAKDLSTYDALVTWDTYIPLITPYFGNHLSIFCLLMTATQIVSTKFNMEMTTTGQPQMPGMKAMMYLMPLMMMFFFNEYASGLTYYYFISTLITIGQTVLFRYTIDEAKLLAKLEQNKRKPQKRSGFMKRLEEAQKIQEEKLRQQKQQRKG